jgi:hypothetical protein
MTAIDKAIFSDGLTISTFILNTEQTVYAIVV